MNASDSKQVAQVLQQVRDWPAAARAALAERLLQSVETPMISKPPKKLPWQDVVGLLRTSEAPPDDRACDNIIEEERQRKHG